MRRSVKWLAYVMAGLAALVALLVIFFDWNWLRHPIERMVTDKTGRALVINGNLNVKLGWPMTRIQVADVTFANPDWCKQPQMFTVKRMDGDISLPQLFRHHFTIGTIRLEQPQISLEQNPDGRKNWLLDRHQKDESAQPEIGRIMLDQGHISYADPAQKTRVQATLSTRQSASQGAANIVFAADGQFKGLPLTAKGSGGTVLALNDQTTPYPLNIDVDLGHTRLQAAGTVTSLTKFSAVDLNMQLAGVSLDRLYPLIGIALPRTPEYQTKGHLLRHARQWRYEKFTARVGKSDVAGDLQIDQGGKRPFLRGDLTLQLLNLEDLGSLVGMSNRNKGEAPARVSADTAADAGTQPAAATGKRKVLPELPFRTERWNSVDADVKIHAKRIQRAQALPIENLTTHVKMNDSVLTLDPLRFGVAGGTLDGAITLNGHTDPIQGKLKIEARKLLLKKLFPTIKMSKASIGQVNGEFELAGKGNAVGKMLADANGKVVLLIDSGEISKLMLETINLHLWEMLQLKITGDKNIKLNCAVANFDVKQGDMQTRALVLDTEINTIIGSGDINMAQETLNLDLEPHTKVLSPVALRSPIYIRGPFANPKVSIDKTRILLRGAGAAALAVLNPFLAIIPLVDSGPGQDSACGHLIHQAKSSVPPVQ